MRKGIIGIMLVAALGSVGATYSHWNKPLVVRMRSITGSFNFHFSPEDQVDASIVTGQNDILETIDGVEMELSADKKEAELKFTHSVPVEQLMDGNFIRIKYLLDWEEGAVFPEVQDEPLFEEPAALVSMEGNVKGIYADGNLYNFTGEDHDFLLDFDLYYQNKWEDEQLYGYIYLGLTDDATDLLDTISGTTLEVGEDDLQEAEYEAVADASQHGIVVEYSGMFSIYFDQINRELIDGEGD